MHQLCRPASSKSMSYPPCPDTGSGTTAFTRGARSSSGLLGLWPRLSTLTPPPPTSIPSAAQSSSTPNMQGPPALEKQHVVLKTLHPLSHCPVLFFSGPGCTCPGSGSHSPPPLPLPLTIPSANRFLPSHGSAGLGHPACSSSPSGNSLSPNPSSLLAHGVPSSCPARW